MGADQHSVCLSEEILDRVGLKWLLNDDKTNQKIFFNNFEAKVFTVTCEYSFGRVQKEPQEVKQICQTIQNFKAVKDKPAIMVLFLGLSNHWVCLVAHHPGLKNLSKRKLEKLQLGHSLTKIYLLDSAQTPHLDVPLDKMPDYIIEKQRSKCRVGMPPSTQFGAKFFTHNYCDLRFFLSKLSQIFQDPKLTLTKMYTSGMLQGDLRDFVCKTHPLPTHALRMNQYT